MTCKFCGREVPEGEKVCPACGTTVDADSAEAKETEQTQQGLDSYGTQGQEQQEQPKYGMMSQGVQSQEQQGQYQNGSFGQEQQGQYQYGSFNQDQNQYGAYNQDQNQYGSFNQDQNQYSSYNQNQYQYGAPDQASYSYGKTEGGNYGQPMKPISGTPYIIFAIITTLFCCLPLGIAAIVFACRINPLQKAGDYEGAQDEAKKAKIATIVGMVVGAIISTIYIGLAIVGFREYAASDTASSVESIKDSDAFKPPFESSNTDDDDDLDIDDIDELDEEDDEEDGESKPAPQMAEASSELGATWDTFTVQINDKVLTLPCTMEELEAAGLTLDTEDTPENYVVNAREYVYTYFEDANDNEILVDIVNLSEEPKSLRECIIGGVTVYDSDLENGGLSVIFPGGVQIGTPKDEVLAKYGNTEEGYDDEDFGVYTWYADNAYYSYCEIDVDDESGLVTSMFMENYGE